MTDIDAPLLRSLRDLGQLSVLDHSLPEMLDRIVVIANDAVVAAAKAGLTLDVAGSASTAAYTDDDVPEIDAAQYATGHGPGLHAALHGEVVNVPSIGDDERWPRFAAACVSHGIRSTLSTPVIARSAKRAALNFYATSERAFDADDIELAEALAMQAAVAIENAEAYYSARQLADQLQGALDTRIVIEQAKGLLMARGQSSDEAFEVLRRASQRENRKVREIAADVVAEAERRALLQ
jgi:GAF domain-containing protein